MRRVSIDDGPPDYYLPAGDDYWDADDPFSLSDEQRWFEDRRRQEAELAEAVAPADQADDDHEGDCRERDLAPREPVPSPRNAPLGLSPEQKRVRDEWLDVRPDDDELSAAVEEAGVRGASVGFKEDLSRELATVYLREHDPQRTAPGILAEITDALGTHELNIADRASVFASGRPSAARKALRAAWADALRPLYDDGRSRVLMCEVLGCSRPALDALIQHAA